MRVEPMEVTNLFPFNVPLHSLYLAGMKNERNKERYWIVASAYNSRGIVLLCQFTLTVIQ